MARVPPEQRRGVSEIRYGANCSDFRLITIYYDTILFIPRTDAFVKRFVDHGGRLAVLGEDVSGIPQSPRKIVFAADPGGQYYNALENDFAAGSANPPRDFLKALGDDEGIQLDAPPTVAANFAVVNGALHVYLANFGELVPGKIAVPTPITGVQVKVTAAMGDSLSYLPFLGEKQIVRGVKRGHLIEFTLPPLKRGAVVSFAATDKAIKCLRHNRMVKRQGISPALTEHSAVRLWKPWPNSSSEQNPHRGRALDNNLDFPEAHLFNTP